MTTEKQSAILRLVKGNDEEDPEVLIFRESSVGVRWQSSVQVVIPSEPESPKHIASRRFPWCRVKTKDLMESARGVMNTIWVVPRVECYSSQRNLWGEFFYSSKVFMNVTIQSYIRKIAFSRLFFCSLLYQICLNIAIILEFFQFCYVLTVFFAISI